MPFTKIIIHAVWGTKDRFPYLISETLNLMIHHIRSNARKKGIFIDSINGYAEHIHCLLELKPDMSVSTAIQLIKGESSFWAYKEKLTSRKFEWADEYYAASV